MKIRTDIVTKAQVDDRLYILDNVAHQIELPQGVTQIYVPSDSFNSYKELNPTLNILSYNYNSIKVQKPEFYEQVAVFVTTESNPELMEVLYSRGLCANENYMTLAEAKACTNEDVDQLLKGNTTVKSFNEFQYFTGVTEIKDRLAQDASELVCITLPKTVTKIGALAFGISGTAHNKGTVSKLERVEGVENVEELSQSVFQFAEVLKSLNYTQKLTTIGQNAFYYCTKLETVGDVSNVSSLAQQAFYNCQKIHSLNFTSKLSGVLKDTFYFCTSLISVGDMRNITQVNGAFNRCIKLRYLNFSNKLTSIIGYAFFYCTELIDLGDLSGVVTLGDSSKIPFGYMFDLQQDLNLPKITTINKNLFRLNAFEGWGYVKNPLNIYFGKSYEEMTKKGKIVSNDTGKTSAIYLKIYFNGVEATPEQYATLI